MPNLKLEFGGVGMSLFHWVGLLIFGGFLLAAFLDIVNLNEKGCADGGPWWFVARLRVIDGRGYPTATL
jgi:hypothetical protein